MTAPAKVLEMEGATKYEPMLADIAAAFKLVFPEESIREVHLTQQPDRQVFTITSDKMNRTYQRADSTISFESVLRDTPHLDSSKIA